MSDVPARTLDDIAAEINNELDSFNNTNNQLGELQDQWRELQSNGAQHVMRIGRLLTEAKVQVKHGAWNTWCKKHFGTTGRNASKYARVFNNKDEVMEKLPNVSGPDTFGGLGPLEGCLKLIAAPNNNSSDKPKSTPKPQPTNEPSEKAELVNDDTSEMNPPPPVNDGVIDVEHEDIPPVTSVEPESTSEPTTDPFKDRLLKAIWTTAQPIIDSCQAKTDTSEGKEHKVRTQWMKDGHKGYTEFVSGAEGLDDPEAIIRAAKCINVIGMPDLLRKKGWFDPPESEWNQDVMPSFE